ncbi:hypothetical protein D3C84_763130 [compost metagenome]
MNDPFDLLLQVLGRRRLTTALEQFAEFAAEGGDFAVVLLQATIAAIVQHGQWIDCAIERQFAPQAGEDLGTPFMGNAGVAQVLKPDRRDGVTGIPQPCEPMPGEHHAPITVAESAFGAGGINAACLGHLRRHGVLAAQAVLQQDQLGPGGQARRQLRHSVFGIIGFAGHQQAIDRLFTVGCFGRHRVVLCRAMLDQCQSASRFIGLQARAVAQDQPHRHPGPCQARGPQRAEAAGAKNMPGGGHQLFALFIARMGGSQ